MALTDTQRVALRYFETPSTANDVPVSHATIASLMEAKLIKVAGVVRDGSRGRPPRTFVLTAKGARTLG